MAGRLVDRVKSLVSAALRDLSDAQPGDDGAAQSSAQVRHIDLALADVRDQLGAALARRYQLAKQVNAQATALDAVAGKAAIAIAADREDLARAAFEHQRDADLQAETARGELSALDAEIARLETLASELAAARQSITGAPTAQGRTAALAELDALVARVAGEEAR